MKITIESTTKIVEFSITGKPVMARVWQGETDTGIPVQVFVTRIAPEIEESDPKFGKVQKQFSAELQACATPRPTVEAIPLRLII